MAEPLDGKRPRSRWLRGGDLSSSPSLDSDMKKDIFWMCYTNKMWEFYVIAVISLLTYFPNVIKLNFCPNFSVIPLHIITQSWLLSSNQNIYASLWAKSFWSSNLESHVIAVNELLLVNSPENEGIQMGTMLRIVHVCHRVISYPVRTPEAELKKGPNGFAS